MTYPRQLPQMNALKHVSRLGWILASVCELSTHEHHSHVLHCVFDPGFHAGAGQQGCADAICLKGKVVHDIGLAAVFAASATVFAVLKVLGATCLAYLARGTYLAPVRHASTGSQPVATSFQMFTRGFVMNLTNTKVFFSALLPQFVQVESGSVTPLLCADAMTVQVPFLWR